MDQVSRPVLIALLATVAMAAGWMAFMRPAAVESTTEEVTAPAQVATQAAEAAKATDAKSAETEAAADAATADPSSATQAPTAPAQAEAGTAKAKKAATPAPAGKKDEPTKAAKADPQAKVLAEMDSGKVVVLLFWDKAGADDRAARDAARDVNRRDGKVVVHIVDVRDVGRYDSVTQGVTVTQSPTTMIISPDGTARTIAGLSEPTEVDQLVRAALPRK